MKGRVCTKQASTTIIASLTHGIPSGVDSMEGLASTEYLKSTEHFV